MASSWQSRKTIADDFTLWLPAIAILFLVSSQTGMNHHMRYVLPIFPFVIISTSRLGAVLANGSWKTKVPVTFCLTWGVVSSLSIFPHSLSYFNEAAGGPDNGHFHLVDSNIDWGQDLLFLKNWLDRHPEAGPIRLAYFNVIDPGVIGIEFTLPPAGFVPSGDEHTPTERSKLGPMPGYFAVSVNYLRGLRFTAPDGTGNRQAIGRSDYQYFLRFQPVAKAGWSIYIYHITLDQANGVRKELALQPVTTESSP
jgi:hypothetical protein